MDDLGDVSAIVKDVSAIRLATTTARATPSLGAAESLSAQLRVVRICPSSITTRV